ncbi:uncharacterized protein LOC101740699 isoform X1 [Bombyx mori]|uniref:uncharacterized protein LOC101740699 isoform X1 n=1 Tax=Bombyx mori TaxID=7091 RepID=UPI002ED29C65
MASKFTKNAILTRTLHSCCLVCETYLPSERDVALHISKEEHKKSLEASSFVAEFIEDRIRKVKKGFFCEFCNKYLSTIIKGRFHVTGNEHIRNKGAYLFERLENGMVLFRNIVITKEAWNGIIGKKCIICAIEFNDVKKHITSVKHIFNMLKFDVQFGIYGGLYRKTMDDSFHCLTCNEVFESPTRACISSHFLHPNHQEIYDKLEKSSKEQIEQSNYQQKLSNLTDPKGTAESKDPILKKVPMERYINDFYPIKNPCLGGTDIVINMRTVVNIFSFYFITQLNSLICEVCEVTLTLDEIDTHKVTKKHERAMMDTPVIVLRCAEDEFIREVMIFVYLTLSFGENIFELRRRAECGHSWYTSSTLLWYLPPLETSCSLFHFIHINCVLLET